jgi:hypothetical protein
MPDEKEHVVYLEGTEKAFAINKTGTYMWKAFEMAAGEELDITVEWDFSEES